jgi:hypothetical protein
MDKLLAKIGWAAAGFQPHAHLLTIQRNDPNGSAVADDEETDERTEKPIVNEDDFLEEDDLDDAPIRGRRTDKSARAYDELKSERDRLRADLDKKDRLLEEHNARLARLEQSGTRESREDVNRRADEERERIKTRSRALVDKVKAIPADDPERGTKIYEAMEEHNARLLEEQEARLLQAIDQRSSDIVTTRLTREDQRERAKEAALTELREQGFTRPQDLTMLTVLAEMESQENPGWDRRMPNEEQIPYLVGKMKELRVGDKRTSQEARDEKRRHREDQDGVLGETSTTKRRSFREQDDEGDETEGPGSMLADLKRWKSGQRQSTNRMLGRDRLR